MKNKKQSDIDKYSVQTYNKNFNENHKPTDIREIRTDDIPEIDMLCGGFPCQAFSIAGKRRGFEDTRGTLFFEVARLIKAKRPKIVFLENVKGLLNHEKGKTFRTIIQTISELGYNVQWMVLNSKFFGVPQNRERVFIIGSLRGECRPEILPFRETSEQLNKRNAKEQIASSLQHPGHSGGNYKGMNMIYDKLGKVYGNGDVSQAHRVYSPEGVITSQRGCTRSLIKTRAVLTPDREKKRQNGRRFKEEGEPSFTLTGQDIHGVMQDMEIRRLTPIECERLQGFPDGWTEGVSDTQRYKQMGNAVTVNVIEAIARKLLKNMIKSETKHQEVIGK